MSDSDEAHLLSILDSHGKSFLEFFSPLHPAKPAQKRKAQVELTTTNKRRGKSEQPTEDTEEWHGIVIDSAFYGSSEEINANNSEEDSDYFEHSDNEIVADNTEKNVVVFSDIAPKRIDIPDAVSKAQMKAFMSSKISKLSSSSAQALQDKKGSVAEEEEDRTNSQNDALLHKLVHTKLLSGSMNTELDLPPAKRRKALAGRILELTGGAKLGKGENLVREAERNKAAKHIREGISQKKHERNKQELEEAKNLGNYHPTLKNVFEASSSTATVRKREKGLSMGVGKFRNGHLRLSKIDVQKAIGEGDRDFSRRGSSRAGSRGRGQGPSKIRN